MRRLTRYCVISALIFSACSIVNAPNEGNLDAGVDGLDAPDAPDGDGGPPPTEVCDDLGGVDEDGNGFANCADWACAGAAICCSDGGGGTEAVDFTDEDDWERIGVTGGAGGLYRPTNGNESGFFQANDCSPVFTGAEYLLELQIPENCITDSDGCSVGFVGSVINAAAGNEQLRQDFAAELEVGEGGAGALVVRSVEREVARVPVDLPQGTLVMTVALTPGEVNGAQGLLVQVGLDNSSVSVPAIPLLRNSDLVRDCADGLPGLHLGIRVKGSFLVQRLEQRELACANPAVFDAASFYSADASGTQPLNLSAYGPGSIQDPGLFVVEGSDELMMVLTGSELPPSLEGIDGNFRWDLIQLRAPIAETGPLDFTPMANPVAMGVVEADVFNRAGSYYGWAQGADLEVTRAGETPSTHRSSCAEVAQPAFGGSVDVAPSSPRRHVIFLCDGNVTAMWIEEQAAVAGPATSVPMNFGGLRPIDIDIVDDEPIWDETTGRGTLTHNIWVLLEDSRGRTSLNLYRAVSTLTINNFRVIPEIQVEPFVGNPVLRSDQLNIDGAQLESVAVVKIPNKYLFMFGYEGSRGWRLLSTTQTAADMSSGN